MPKPPLFTDMEWEAYVADHPWAVAAPPELEANTMAFQWWLAGYRIKELGKVISGEIKRWVDTWPDR